MDVDQETLREAGYVRTETREIKRLARDLRLSRDECGQLELAVEGWMAEVRTSKAVAIGLRQEVGRLAGNNKVGAESSSAVNRKLQAEIVQLRELLLEVRKCSTHALTPGSQYKPVWLDVALLNSIVKALDGGQCQSKIQT